MYLLQICFHKDMHICKYVDFINIHLLLIYRSVLGYFKDTEAAVRGSTEHWDKNLNRATTQNLLPTH